MFAWAATIVFAATGHRRSAAAKLTSLNVRSKLRSPDAARVPEALDTHRLPKERRMVAPADQPRRVLHYPAALVRDTDGFTARCLELGWLCAAGRDLEEAIAHLRDLVEMELSHRAGPWPLFAMVVPLDVPAPQERA
jgi:hypothetical protein